jgi:glycosyltransferase involved in cell wall biosynthesis
MKINNISFVLPCRNEKESLKEVIKQIKSTCEKEGVENYEIIVSDSSWDGSDKIAIEEGVKLVKHNTEGYGFAIREGVKNAKYENIIYADPDRTYDFSEFPKLLEKLDECDIVIGNRLKGKISKGAMPFTHRFIGTPAINGLIKTIFRIKITDSQSGFRVLKKKTFEDLNLATNGMEFASEMIIQAKKSKKKIIEIPINYKVRKGTSKLNTYKDGMAHFKYIILRTPFLFYSLTGTILLLLGLISLFFGNKINEIFNSATFKILFPIIGIQIIFLGLFSKTYIYRKFKQENMFLKKFYKIFHLKHAFIFGILLIIIPIILKILNDSRNIFDILLVSSIIGIQIIFNSLYLSQLSIE